jgi:CheY-like chemotaxis protein
VLQAWAGTNDRGEVFMDRVLLIDDDASILELVSSFLGQLGYDVTVAHNGKEGIECLQKVAEFKVVITDIRMPVKDGNEVARYVKNSSGLNPLPIIAITGFARDMDKNLFDYVLEKPFKMKDLAAVIELFGS